MSRDMSIKKVLVIGSGPIVIGQAAEFDYAGTQCCRSLKEEGVEVVLLNSNPATIMTDGDIADKVYIEPLTVEVVEQLILKEKPDSVLPTMGGQAGLNLAMELEDRGFLKENNVRLIGTTSLTIKKAEDRQMFKDTMEKIGEPVAASEVVHSLEHGIRFAEKIGYPVVLRPAYTLGGSGGGIAHNENELREILANGLRLSRVHEVLVERYIGGWKEIEYEVMRDSAGNVITVCNMENIDPVGVHTGDSIVVAPSQTLGDKEYQMLRTSALNIITELGITGGCNVQYALNPDSFEYCVIEVNPRVSRSSALASKATGYPIAKVAAKIALGYTLDEIPNAITKKTFASFEPMLDYCVVKIPRLPFDKFITAKRTLTTQMKATGEVMSICTNFEGALMKAIRSLEQHVDSLMSYDFTGLSEDQLIHDLSIIDDMRIWRIAEALRRGIPYDRIHSITKIDIWFIDKIARLVEMENTLKSGRIDEETLREAKRMEFPDYLIAKLNGTLSEDEVKEMRKQAGITAAYKMVDTCAAEFSAETPYFYSVYGGENEAVSTGDRKKVLVLGSGPIRIGQGIEFDFCSVHATWAFEKEGYETIIINNNPETVSTDFDIADKLYFEPLTPEDVENVVNVEHPDGAVVQFGGQTAIKLTEALMKMGVPILGTSASDVDAAEDRERFDQILRQTGIPRASGGTVFTAEEGVKVANELGYPVLVRPSYVLGGQGMQIAISDDDIREYIGVINRYTQEHPILVDKYLAGTEIEVDAVCDGEDILIPGIMQHIERAGVIPARQRIARHQRSGKEVAGHPGREGYRQGDPAHNGGVGKVAADAAEELLHHKDRRNGADHGKVQGHGGGQVEGQQQSRDHRGQIPHRVGKPADPAPEVFAQHAGRRGDRHHQKAPEAEDQRGGQKRGKQRDDHIPHDPPGGQCAADMGNGRYHQMAGMFVHFSSSPCSAWFSRSFWPASRSGSEAAWPGKRSCRCRSRCTGPPSARPAGPRHI